MSFLLEQAGGQAFTGKERVYLLLETFYHLHTGLKLLANFFFAIDGTTILDIVIRALQK